MIPRPFSEHVTLLCNFAACVEALSPEAWERLRERCRALDGSEPAAVFARAQLAAWPWRMAPARANEPWVMRTMREAFHATQVGIALTGELVESAFPSSDRDLWRRSTSSENPDRDRYSDAFSTIEHALARHHVRTPGISTAVRAAAQAVLRHDFLTPADFDRVYQWVAPEIPYATVDPTATTAPPSTTMA